MWSGPWAVTRWRRSIEIAEGEKRRVSKAAQLRSALLALLEEHRRDDRCSSIEPVFPRDNRIAYPHFSAAASLERLVHRRIIIDNEQRSVCFDRDAGTDLNCIMVSRSG